MELVMPSLPNKFQEHSTHLHNLLNTNPAEAVNQARKIDFHLETDKNPNLMMLRAAILVDGGALTQQKEAIEEGITLFRELQTLFPNTSITYNLANGLIAAAGTPPPDRSLWLRHQESTRQLRAEARRHFWKAAQDIEADLSLRTQAWTNLANQFSNSFRLGEAHDAWLAALEVDPKNGVAASSAAQSLLWLYMRGGCSELTRTEAIMLAKVAHQNQGRVIQYAGAQAAAQIAAFASTLEDPKPRAAHKDAFMAWVEKERLTLAPTVELVDPAISKLDWLTLPGIMERDPDAAATPPPIFAMFNMLKSDFILARDLLWRATGSAWPSTGSYGDTLDYANYGPDTSALILSHRTALDVLDKVAVTANHYFELGLPPDGVYFGKMWRGELDKATGTRPLTEKVEKAILGGASALYGLVELAEDYASSTGILRSQKDLRNAGTHRFVVLHDFGDPIHRRHADEIERHERTGFTQEALRALRVARSSIQMLALAISQHEQGLSLQANAQFGTLVVPDHDWIRGYDDEV